MWLADDADEEVVELSEAMTHPLVRAAAAVEDEVKSSGRSLAPRRASGTSAARRSSSSATEDVADILEIADVLATAIPGARKAVIEGAGHLPSLERPDELNRLLLDFLR